MKKRKSRFPAKIVLVSSLFLAGIFLILFLFYYFLTNSGFFEIRDSDRFSGQNIFKLNLREEAQKLSRQNPDYKQVVLGRLLPDKIEVDFIAYKPIARVELSEYFCVDEQGVLFCCTGQKEDILRLPLITGLASRISHPRSGIRYNENSLLAALEFIIDLSSDKKLTKQIKIKEMNLANANDIFLFTVSGCKINLGIAKFLKKKLSVLRSLFGESNFNLANIEYIDLRFREPVVKHR